VLDHAGSAARDERNRHSRAYGGEHLDVVARLGAVGVDGVEQDLARSELLGPGGPGHRVETGAGASAVRRHLEAAGRHSRVAAARVDREDQHLRAEPLGDLADQIGPRDGRVLTPTLSAPARSSRSTSSRCARRRPR
jgi:hypothetical protein